MPVRTHDRKTRRRARLDCRCAELPEVEALALDLEGRLKDRAIVKAYIVAISALKTFDPPVSALEGTLVEGVTRHGKFLDIETSGPPPDPAPGPRRLGALARRAAADPAPTRTRSPAWPCG